jgi:hydrogenase-4 membrane subunit HyfE
MRELSETEIDFIRDDIRRRGVFTETLADNLLDHLCCFIEEQQQDQRSFEQIYQQALEAFGQNGLQEVQDETLFLINQPHFKAMKKFMYISGAIASIFLLIASLMKVMHWPGASILFILAATLFIFLFLPYYIYTNYQEQTEKKGKMIAVLGIVTAVMLCLATVFKIMHWPGAAPMFIMFTVLFLVFLPLYILNGIRNPLTKSSSLSNGFLFASIGSFALLVSFRQPSQSTQETMKQIETNQQKLLLELKSNNSDEQTKAAFLSFNNAFDKIRTEFLSPDDESILGEGGTIDNVRLENLNKEISLAIQDLNAAMKEKTEWRIIQPVKIGSAVSGSVKFQLLQLQCNVNAASN